MTARGTLGLVPIYDYKCAACGEVREHVLLGFDAPAPEACPACEQGPLTRVYAGSSPSIAFNGWGFSRTDGLIRGDTSQKDFKALKERADRIVNE